MTKRDDDDVTMPILTRDEIAPIVIVIIALVSTWAAVLLR